MKRNDFLRTAALSVAGIGLTPRIFASVDKYKLGAQLWTIREPLKKQLEWSLNRLVEIGYTEIELFGYNGGFWGKSAKEFGDICKQAGLNIISSHYDTGRHDNAFGTLKNGWDKAIEDAAALNIQYMICAWLYTEERNSMDLYKSLSDMLNDAADSCQKAKIQFGYHAHNFEFPPIDGTVPYEYLLKHTDADKVKFEADLYWFTKAGEDPVSWFERFPGRFPLWHVKDMEKNTGDFAEVGQGAIDFDRIFKARRTAGLKYWFVEQDECKRDPFKSLMLSRDYLLKKRY